MIRSSLRFALFSGLLLGSSALAQDMNKAEVVVTASRYAESGSPLAIPHITLPRRADFVITRITVICDTREPRQRDDELRATLRGMMTAAEADPQIALSTGDDFLGDLTDATLEQIITGGDRDDTSQAMLVLKTAVQPEDTLDATKARLKSFIDKTQKTGRTEIMESGTWDLTLIGPERNRADLLRLIADDARAAAGAFGPGIGVSVEGLQAPITWHQTAPLELSLYIPYVLKVGSTGAGTP